MKEITTFDEHPDNRYDKIDSEKRTDFEIKAKAFAIGKTGEILTQIERFRSTIK